MLKKTLTYEDFNGVVRTEDFYFNLTKAEIMEMELSTTGGYTEYLKRIIAAQDNASLVAIFKELVLKSYGKKSDDGRRFIKTKELSEEFEQTNAYSNFFTELATNSKEATAFVNGIIPADIRAEIEKEKTDAKNQQALAPYSNPVVNNSANN